MWLFESCCFLHVRPRESEGTACVVVVYGTRFESLFIYFFARMATHGTNWFWKLVFERVDKLVLKEKYFFVCTMACLNEE